MLGPGPTWMSCDRLSKDTVIKAFQPARTEPQPGQDSPCNPYSTHFTWDNFPSRRGNIALLCASKVKKTLVFWHQKDHLGFASLWKEEAQQRGTSEPPWGVYFPGLWVGTVGNSATYSWDLASRHLVVSANPQVFLSPCCVLSTVLSIYYH